MNSVVRCSLTPNFSLGCDWLKFDSICQRSILILANDWPIDGCLLLLHFLGLHKGVTSIKDERPYSNEEDFLLVLVNGECKKIFRGWLEGSGRGANSALSRMILGTEEGLTGCHELTIAPDLAPYFDGVLFWLALGCFGPRPMCEPFQARSIKLYELASYFGLEKMMETIRSLGWRSQSRSRTVSVNNIGCVANIVPGRDGLGGFGFMLDKATRKTIWFSLGSVVTTNADTGTAFNVGSECMFDIVVPGKGRKPNDPKAINIRAMGDEPFHRIDVDGTRLGQAVGLG